MVQEQPHEYKAGEHCPRCKCILIKDDDEIKCPICSRIYNVVNEKREVSQIVKIDRSTISDEEVPLEPKDQDEILSSLSKSAENNETVDSAHGVPNLNDLSSKLSAITDGNEPSKIKLENKPKAHIVLEDSDTEDYGVVKDTRNDIMWVAGNGDVVGTWSRSKVDGLIHISLIDSINALYDRAVMSWAKNVEARKVQKIKKSRTSDGTRKPGRPKLEKPQQTVVVSDKDRAVINDMKAKLMGLRG